MDILKLNPEVYRRAAEVIDKEVFCCCALAAVVTNREAEQYVAFFATFFKPNTNHYLEAWWAAREFEPRTLALLLCADILESEQKAQRSRKR